MIHTPSKDYIINAKYKQPGSFRNQRIARETKRLINANGGLSEEQLNYYKAGMSLKVNLYLLYKLYNLPIPLAGEFSKSLHHTTWLDIAMFIHSKSVYEYE